MIFKTKHIKREKIIALLLIILFVFCVLFFIFCLPNPLFDEPYSVVVEDVDGEMLGVKISADQQWRFPESNFLNEKFKVCIVNFEDSRFYFHNGFDPIAFARAIKQNISNKKIVSGGSTITMQTIRLMRHNKKRSVKEKFVEIFLSIRLESTYSKEEILQLYASHAPFGGNVVGIDAAAWRYFERNQNNLSWAENAMLAVLPNNPSYINTAKNRELLKQKRDNLLLKLKEKKIITEVEFLLSKEEEIPQHPQPYPMHAYHLVQRAAKDFKKSENIIKTTLHIKEQKMANDIISRYNRIYRQNNINNIACLILEVNTGNVIAYVGNTDFDSQVPEKDVDMVMAYRSTGSILKPFLYAACLSDGAILPKTLLKDIPTKMGGFSPENFSKSYDGAVHADNALARSLNIPFVHLLKEYGTYKFLSLLRQLGLKSINRSSEHYGLSLVLGGAESNLWQISSGYASMARSLKYYTSHQAKYDANAYHSANYIQKTMIQQVKIYEKDVDFLNAASIWQTFEAMTAVNRPGAEGQWQNFSSKQKVAWKTGTSFGFKDAWSVAVTPDYVVGVWVGNATGEAKAGIIGVKIAAPVLFEILNILPSYKKWFEKPLDNMLQISTCRKSGFIAGQSCEIVDSAFISVTGINSPTCPYCKTVNLDETENFIVNSDCYPLEKIVRKSWFILPPSMEYYYKDKNRFYLTLPPTMEGCDVTENQKVMEIIYPNHKSKVYIPINLQGDTLAAVFKVAHRDKDAEIYWFVNENYVTTTKDIHEKEFKLKANNYVLTLIDDKGNRCIRQFTVVDRK